MIDLGLVQLDSNGNLMGTDDAIKSRRGTCCRYITKNLYRIELDSNSDEETVVSHINHEALHVAIERVGEDGHALDRIWYSYLENEPRKHSFSILAGLSEYGLGFPDCNIHNDIND